MKNLKTLALAATPGPWMLLSVGDDDKNIAVCDEMGVSLLTVRSEGDVNFAAVYEDADAAYIAAASPDAILALLADLEKHRALMVEHLAVIDPLRAERDRLREALTDTRKRLKEANESGVITDTLWYSQYETLFDYIDSALEEAR